MKISHSLIAASAILIFAQSAFARNSAESTTAATPNISGSTVIPLPAVTPGTHKSSNLSTGMYQVFCSNGAGYAHIQTITKTIGGFRQMVVNIESASNGSGSESAQAYFQVLQTSTGLPVLETTLTQPITFQLVGGEACIVSVNNIPYVTPNSFFRRPGYKTLTALGHNRYSIPVDAFTQYLQSLEFQAAGDPSKPCHRTTADINEININGAFVGITTTKARECGDCDL